MNHTNDVGFTTQDNSSLREDIRYELQHFALTDLRVELAKACKQLQFDLVKELRELPLSEPGCRSGALTTVFNSQNGHDQQLCLRSSRSNKVRMSHVTSTKWPRLPDVDHFLLPKPPSLDGASDDGPTSFPACHKDVCVKGEMDQMGTTKSPEDSGCVSFVPGRQQDVYEEHAISASATSKSEKCDNITHSWTGASDRASASECKNKGGKARKTVMQMEKESRHKLDKPGKKNSWHSEEIRAALVGIPEAAFSKRKQLAEHSISFVIFLNGIFIGVQTDYQARHLTETVPTTFHMAESFFCFIFTSELCVKLFVHRLSLFYRPGWMWNVFDTMLVIVQLTEVVGWWMESSTSQLDLGFVRLLRVLRLLRILRLVRLLQFVDELAVIVNSIAHSSRSLCWTVFLLLMMKYIVAIVCAQIVFTHRLSVENDTSELDRWWGSVSKSVLSLYQAIMGGIDWDRLVRPMMDEISPYISIFFSMYIAFALLAVMNVITGTFVQSSCRDADRDKVRDFTEAAREAFCADDEPQVSNDIFEQTVANAKFGTWLKAMEITGEDAMLLFTILEKESDSPGFVDTDTLVHELVRLREGVKYMDIMKILFQESLQGDRFDELAQLFDQRLDQISGEISKKILAELPKR